MKEYLEEAPQSWSERLVLSAVPKDGTLYSDGFALSAGLPVSYWGQLYTLLSDMDVKVRAYRSEGRVILTVAAEAEVSAPCARCLEPAREKIHGELRYVLSLRRGEERAVGEPESDGDEEIIALDSWEDEIDLAPRIWEALITSLPCGLLCRPDCRGLCPQCGANLNEAPCGCKKDAGDPRFDVLKNFMRGKGNDTAKNQK